MGLPNIYYVKAGLEKEKAVLLVVLAALSDGSKVVVSVTSGYRESTESWSEVLRDLKRRGMNAPRLVIADGHLGIWGALCVSDHRKTYFWDFRRPATGHANLVSGVGSAEMDRSSG